MLLLFLIFSLTIFVTKIIALEQCTTPSQQPGECVIINHCPFLFSLAMDSNKTEETKQFLQNSHCGHVARIIPKVCCALEMSTNPMGRNLLPDPKISQNCGVYVKDNNKQRAEGEAALNQYPWDALIEYENIDGDRSFYCGGTLINKQYVLTAAHCVRGHHIPKNSKIVSVRLGEYNTEADPDCEYNFLGTNGDCLDPPQNIPVAETIIHEHYNPFHHHHDIALLRLKNKLNFKSNSNIQPICLPLESRNLNLTNQVLPLSGWTKIRDGAHHYIKRTGNAIVWNHSKCNLHYNGTKLHEEGQLCAGGQNYTSGDVYSYPGDTGGLLMKAPDASSKGYAAVGVLAKGPAGCCHREHHPRIYTRIGNYVVWIINKLKP